MFLLSRENSFDIFYRFLPGLDSSSRHSSQFKLPEKKRFIGDDRAIRGSERSKVKPKVPLTTRAKSFFVAFESSPHSPLNEAIDKISTTELWARSEATINQRLMLWKCYSIQGGCDAMQKTNVRNE